MVDRYRVLLVDDDGPLLASLGDLLQRDGFDVTTARSGREALAALDAAWPDLVLLELAMPGMSGQDLAAHIKKRADIPIIVLSRITAVESKVDAISRYAEDYVTKPAHHDELAARIRRVLSRRDDRVPGRALVLGPNLTLVLQRRQAIVDGIVVGLSRTEARFLSALATNVGQSVSTERLLARVWSDADGADPAYVWVMVRRLRRKIEGDPGQPRYLVTERAGGYRLVAEHMPDGTPSVTSEVDAS